MIPTGSPRSRLPFLIIVFFGVATFGVLLSWREQLFQSQEYVDFPPAPHIITPLRQRVSSSHNQLRKELNQ